MTQWVYPFIAGKTKARGVSKNLFGGKGANLIEMVSLGLPVPPGFTVTTEVCTYFYDHKKSYPSDLKKQVAAAVKKIEQAVGSKFGDAKTRCWCPCDQARASPCRG